MVADQENIEDIINDFAISLLGQHTVSDIVWDLAKNCILRLSVENCDIFLLDEEQNVLVQKASYQSRNAKDFTIYHPIEIPIGEGIVGTVARTGLSEMIGDTSMDLRHVHDDALQLSEIAVPIVLDDKVIGVIHCAHSDRNFFNDKHRRMLTLIGSLCASKIMWVKKEESTKLEHHTLQDAQQKLAEFKIYALRSQINPHFIFNALNAIQSLIVTKHVDQAIRYLSLVGQFIRKVMASSEGSVTSLANEIEILIAYLDLEKLRFGEKFNYEINTGPDMDPLRIQIPPLLIQLFAANSISDELLDEDDPGILHIEFRHWDDVLICSIKSESQFDHSPFDEQRQQHLWTKVNDRVGLLNGVYAMNIVVAKSKANSVEIKLPLPKPGPESSDVSRHLNLNERTPKA